MAALILVVIGAIMPFIGLPMCWVALGLATISAFAGSRGWPVAVVAIAAVAFWFFTPSLWVEALAHNTGYGAATGNGPILRIVSLIMLAAPVVGIFMARPAQREH
ncbi:hypothetical protein D9R08_06685 [Rhodophyticola porphyridii]|uniref:Uncharacterized protein n=1 Tax=Rhodophyticola porphyridii TaxID=1852017 RepID=A0A3L9YAK1_9RHOB|nr:hypothetical protein D9R08_06685 [Rhodophyticola porphyridii]